MRRTGAMHGTGNGDGNGNGNGNGDGNGNGGNMLTCDAGQTLNMDGSACVAKTPEQIAADTAAAETKRTAIGNWGVAQGPGSTISVTRDNDGTKVTVNSDDLMQAMNLGDGTTMHTLKQPADGDGNVVEQIVILTSDIEAPTAKPFAEVYMLNEHADVDAGEDDDYTAYRLLDGVAIDYVSKIAGFDTATAGLQTFVGDNDQTPADEAQEVDGTFDGAMGTYRCFIGECSVEIGDTGDQLGVVRISSNWQFIPDPGAMVADAPDTNYMNYGFWLMRTTDADDVLTYNEVRTIAEVQGDGGSGISVGQVTGMATYLGGATGVYVHDADDESTSGHFTADAELTATFSTTQGVGTVSGTIDNFMLSGKETNTWGVTLEGTIDNTDGTATGTAKSSMDDASGNMFGATFHGNAEPATSDKMTVYPSSVVGEFSATFDNGDVVGAFGATQDMQP